MLSDRLVELRRSRGLSQADLAVELGVSRQAYSLYETERREMDFAALCKLADYFNVSLDYLFGRSTEPLNDEETGLICSYRTLDKRGRETVKNCLTFECTRAIKRASKKSAG